MSMIGGAVSIGGDVNGDEIDDFMVINCALSQTATSVSVIFGRSEGFPNLQLGNIPSGQRINWSAVYRQIVLEFQSLEMVISEMDLLILLLEKLEVLHK